VPGSRSSVPTRVNKYTLEEWYWRNINRPRPPNAASKFRGVSSGGYRGAWRATIYCRGKKYFLGYFDTEIGAAKAYNEHVVRIFGPYALLNNVDGDPEQTS